MLRMCKCDLGPGAEFQDERYGKNMRVHNKQGGKGGGKFRCTVCGDSKQVSSGAVKKDEKKEDTEKKAA